jgi:methylenetetrahydrofolate dehydrogenase (NADP+) / methenyltetrahydrofolate cyclohydrolase
MKIDGKNIAQQILSDLKPQVLNLKKNHITPTLAVILIGNNESSLSYIKQKQLKASEIGAEIKLFHFETIALVNLIELINKLNKDKKIHGIIVQRPMPQEIDRDRISHAIDPKKDVDGFNPKSSFDAPVAKAVIEILKIIEITYLDDYKITVIGKGETAGGPIIKYLLKLGAHPLIVDKQSKNPEELIKNSDIIISASGQQLIKPEILNKNQILIGVGLYLKDGKLKGDYEISEVENKVKYFTPTIGGVGPVNVAFLMSNLVRSAWPK